jgi:hypothetical protein
MFMGRAKYSAIATPALTIGPLTRTAGKSPSRPAFGLAFQEIEDHRST